MGYFPNGITKRGLAQECAPSFLLSLFVSLNISQDANVCGSLSMFWLDIPC